MTKLQQCSWCRKPHRNRKPNREPRLLFHAPGAAICSDCISLIVDMCAEGEIETCERCRNRAKWEAENEARAIAHEREKARRVLGLPDEGS